MLRPSLCAALLLCSMGMAAHGRAADSPDSTEDAVLSLVPAADQARPAMQLPPLDRAWLEQRSREILTRGELEQAGLLERLRSWIRSWLGQRAQDNAWLQQLTERLRLTPAVANVLFWTMSVLIVALAALIVWREMRGLRWQGGRNRRSHTGGVVAAGATSATWPPALHKLPLSQQLPALLQALSTLLQQQQWLGKRAGISNAGRSRELRQRGFAGASAYQRLQQQVDAQIYGGLPAQQAQVAAFQAEAEEIHCLAGHPPHE